MITDLLWLFGIGVAVVVVCGLFVTVRRRLSGEVGFSFGGLPRGADLAARTEALTALAWAVERQRPLSQALWSVLDSLHKRQQMRLRRVAEALEGGAPLAEAMALAPRIFRGALRRLTAVAERHGVLPRVVPRMVERDQASNQSAAWLLALMVLPLWASGIGAFLLMAVVPRIGWIGRSYSYTDPPGMVEALTAGSGAVRITTTLTTWSPIVAILVLWFLVFIARFDGPRAALNAVGEWIPGVRSWLRARWLADVMALLEAMLAQGVPAPDAVAAAAELEGPPVARSALPAAVARLREGAAPAEALVAAMPGWAGWRWQLWAASGDVVAASRSVAAEAAERADRAVQRLGRTVYPITIVLLASTAGAWLYHVGLMSVRVSDALLLGGY